MNARIHPYALIIGMAIGIGLLLVLRHPLTAVFGGFIGILLADLGLKRGQDADKNEKD